MQTKEEMQKELKKAKDDLDLEKHFMPELCLCLELGADKIAISAC